MNNIFWIVVLSLCLSFASFAQTPTTKKKVVNTKAKATHTPLKKKSKQTLKAQATPTATSVPSSEIISSAPHNTSTWTKAWTDKYVIITPKSGYIHVLIDGETLRSSLEGSGMHSAVALDALQLAQSSGLLDPASDLIKLDVVLFKNRDNYGAPMWDSMQRLAHLEFSVKTLSKASADTFQKPDAEWTGLFKSVTFY